MGNHLIMFAQGSHLFRGRLLERLITSHIHTKATFSNAYSSFLNLYFITFQSDLKLD